MKLSLIVCRLQFWRRGSPEKLEGIGPDRLLLDKSLHVLTDFKNVIHNLLTRMNRIMKVYYAFKKRQFVLHCCDIVRKLIFRYISAELI